MPYTAEEFMRAFNVPQPAPKRKRAAKQKRERGLPLTLLAEALGFIPPDDYDTWLKVGMALKYEHGEDIGGAVWADWSAGCAEKFSEHVNAAKLESFQKEDGELITGRTILNMAREHGWDEGEYEFRDVFRDLAKNPIIPPPPSTPKPGQHPLLEFGSDLSIEALIARQESAIVAGLLGPGDQGMLFGESGKGKTFLAVDLGTHVALGKQWYGRDVKRVPVLYVALEGVANFQKRVMAAQRKHGDPGPFWARCKPHVSLNKGEAGAEGLKQILAAAAAQKELTGESTGLIFIDTQVRATAGDEENSAADMMHYLEKRVGELARKTGAAVITLHHPSKQGDLRGSSAIRGGLDMVLKVEGGNLIADKVKDDAEGPLFSFTLEPVTLAHDRRGRPMTSCTVSKAEPVVKSEQGRVGKPVSRAERLLQTSFGDQVEENLTSRVAGTGEVRASLDEVRKGFVARYVASGDSRKSAGAAWRRLIKKLPLDFRVGHDGAGERYLIKTGSC